jgi:hypothetical protein
MNARKTLSTLRPPPSDARILDRANPLPSALPPRAAEAAKPAHSVLPVEHDDTAHWGAGILQAYEKPITRATTAWYHGGLND